MANRPTGLGEPLLIAPAQPLTPRPLNWIGRTAMNWDPCKSALVTAPGILVSIVALIFSKATCYPNEFGEEPVQMCSDEVKTTFQVFLIAGCVTTTLGAATITLLCYRDKLKRAQVRVQYPFEL